MYLARNCQSKKAKKLHCAIWAAKIGKVLLLPKAHSAPKMKAHSGTKMEARSAPKMEAHSGTKMEARSAPKVEAHSGTKMDAQS